MIGPVIDFKETIKNRIRELGNKALVAIEENRIDDYFQIVYLIRTNFLILGLTKCQVDKIVRRYQRRINNPELDPEKKIVYV